MLSFFNVNNHFYDLYCECQGVPFKQFDLSDVFGGSGVLCLVKSYLKVKHKSN